MASPASAAAAREAPVEAALARGDRLMGFGHQLYPDHDPRAAALLERFKLTPEMAGLRAAAEEITGLQPNIDFALVAMSDALKLPKDAPFALFATARCAGWIAHAIEQGQTGALIRPQSVYVGPAPRKAA